MPIYQQPTHLSCWPITKNSLVLLQRLRFQNKATIQQLDLLIQKPSLAGLLSFMESKKLALENIEGRETSVSGMCCHVLSAIGF